MTTFSTSRPATLAMSAATPKSSSVSIKPSNNNNTEQEEEEDDNDYYDDDEEDEEEEEERLKAKERSSLSSKSVSNGSSALTPSSTSKTSLNSNSASLDGSSSAIIGSSMMSTSPSSKSATLMHLKNNPVLNASKSTTSTTDPVFTAPFPKAAIHPSKASHKQSDDDDDSEDPSDDDDLLPVEKWLVAKSLPESQLVKSPSSLSEHLTSPKDEHADVALESSKGMVRSASAPDALSASASYSNLADLSNASQDQPSESQPVGTTGPEPLNPSKFFTVTIIYDTNDYHITTINVDKSQTVEAVIARLTQKHRLVADNYVIRELNSTKPLDPSELIMSCPTHGLIMYNSQHPEHLIEEVLQRSLQIAARRTVQLEKLGRPTSVFFPDETPNANTSPSPEDSNSTLSRIKRNMSLSIRISSPWARRTSEKDLSTLGQAVTAATAATVPSVVVVSPQSSSSSFWRGTHERSISQSPVTPKSAQSLRARTFSSSESIALPVSPRNQDNNNTKTPKKNKTGVLKLISGGELLPPIVTSANSDIESSPDDASEPPPPKTPVERRLSRPAFFGFSSTKSKKVTKEGNDILKTLVKKGMLLKRGDIRNSWKSRLVAITQFNIYFFNNQSELLSGTWRGLLALRDVIQVAPVPDELFHKKNCFLIMTAAKELFFQTNTIDERNDWINSVLSAMTPTSRTKESRRLIGTYWAGGTIGAGGYAEVKMGHHKDTKARVAIKEIKHQPLDIAYTERLRREITLMRELDHPHINKLVDVVQTEQWTYMILEYIEGGTLDDIVFESKDGRLPESVARFLFIKLVSAIQYCHEKRIVHRDLKMENVMVTRTGDLKLIDFGLSNQYDGMDGLLKTFCGTLEYAAPEILSKEKSYYGPATDVWSLGIILFLMLTGTYPFSVEGLNPEMAVKILRRGWQGLNFPSILSPGAISVLQRILVADPTERIDVKELLNHPWMFMSLEDTESPERYFAT